MDENTDYTETLTIKLDSEESRADAKAVGSGILAIQALIKEVQDAFENNETVLIKARPFARGSLEIPIDLIISGAKSLFNEHPLFQKIRQIVSEYFRVKQALQGRSITVEQGNIVVLDHNRIHVDQITLQCLTPRSPVADAHARAFEDIENDSEIKRVKIFSSASQEPIASVERVDFAAFHPETPVDGEELEERHLETRETLIIRQPAFDPELAWRFVWREDKISARVTADDFLTRVAAGEAFAAGDSLVVDLRRPQVYSPAAQTFVNRQPFIVTQVWEHIRRPMQQDLL